jgi:hypothetical protein
MQYEEEGTPAARAVPEAFLVVTIPASDIEVGGEGGQQALVRLKHVIGRVETSWRPASAEEGFEIVRRRLFEPIAAAAAAQCDAVVKAFGGFYRSQRTEFPPGCGEADYERRIKAAYPIHPELLDRLYGEWSTLDEFQQTRGRAPAHGGRGPAALGAGRPRPPDPAVLDADRRAGGPLRAHPLPRRRVERHHRE